MPSPHHAAETRACPQRSFADPLAQTALNCGFVNLALDVDDGQVSADEVPGHCAKQERSDPVEPVHQAAALAGRVRLRKTGQSTEGFSNSQRTPVSLSIAGQYSAGMTDIDPVESRCRHIETVD